MAIKTSLDWDKQYNELYTLGRKLKDSRNCSDMLRILLNIDRLIIHLSVEEINCRRYNKQTAKHKTLLANINAEINNYEQLITMGILCGH